MFKISPVSFKNMYKPASIVNNTSFASRLNNKDEFVRTTNPIKSPETQKPEDSTFLNWVEESGIIEKLLEILRNPDNIIGTGYVHKVYQIPDCDEYVLRVFRCTKFNYNDFNVEKFIDTEPLKKLLPAFTLPKKGRPVVSLLIGAASFMTKNWPYENWNELIDRLLEKNINVIYLGGKDEIEKLREHPEITGKNGIINMIGKCSILEYGRCQCFRSSNWRRYWAYSCRMNYGCRRVKSLGPVRSSGFFLKG